MRAIVCLVFVVGVTMAQRSSYAPRPVGVLQVLSRFNDDEDNLPNRIGETNSTQDQGPLRTPDGAMGDPYLVQQLPKWPREHQPFWYLNQQHIMNHRGQAQAGTQAGQQPSLQTGGQINSQQGGQVSQQPSRQPAEQINSQQGGQVSQQPSRQQGEQINSQQEGQASQQPSRQQGEQINSQQGGQASQQPSRQQGEQINSQQGGQASQQPSRQPGGQAGRQQGGQAGRQPWRWGQPSRQQQRGQASRQQGTQQWNNNPQ